MADEPSLDDFLDAGSDGSDGDEPDEQADEEPADEEPVVDDPADDEAADDESVEDDPADDEQAADEPAADQVDPAVATYDWSPDGAPCAGCGADVERRWLDDGDYVCSDCKEW